MVIRTSDGEEPCWEVSGTLCGWVYDRTDSNEFLARVADWVVDRPLKIIVVLLVTWIVTRILRRYVTRSVQRMVNPDLKSAVERFRKLGVDGIPMLPPEPQDPRRETRANVIAAVVGGAVTVTIWVIAVIIIADIIGIQLGPLIAGAGIAGVAIGFGAQDLVKNWIAGLFVLLEDHYGIGDVVDLGEAVGAVEHFSLRATRLRSLDGTVWHVPNGVVVRAGNLSQVWSVALVDVDVAYDTDLEVAQRVILDTATALCESDEFADDVLEPPELLGVEHLGADGITIRVKVKTVAGQQWALQRRLRAELKAGLERNGIEIPFPQRTLWIRGEPGGGPDGGGSDGDGQADGQADGPGDGR